MRKKSFTCILQRITQREHFVHLGQKKNNADLKDKTRPKHSFAYFDQIFPSIIIHRFIQISMYHDHS